MTLSLVRVDDRLIHGQVVVGWGKALGAKLLILADDEVSANEWERDIYRVGVPPDMNVDFVTVEQAARLVPEWATSSSRTIVVLGDVGAVVRLCELAPQVKQVNLGGIHQAPGRLQRLPYVFMTENEASALQALAARGVDISAQDVPTARAIPLTELV